MHFADANACSKAGARAICLDCSHYVHSIMFRLHTTIFIQIVRQMLLCLDYIPYVHSIMFNRERTTNASTHS